MIYRDFDDDYDPEVGYVRKRPNRFIEWFRRKFTVQGPSGPAGPAGPAGPTGRDGRDMSLESQVAILEYVNAVALEVAALHKRVAELEARR